MSLDRFKHEVVVRINVFHYSICSPLKRKNCFRHYLLTCHHVCRSFVSQMEKASSVLEQMEAELPESSREKATVEELQELLQFWSPYQDRVDCEHRALSALELRVARLLRLPTNLEQAPPIPLCQELQTMQERYRRSGLTIFLCY